MRRAFLYARYSTKGQADGDSFRRQVEAARDFCQRERWQLQEGRTLLDDGVSGYRGKNAEKGALAGFLDNVRGGRVAPGDGLIIESLDRLSRDEPLRSLSLLLELVEAGVAVINLERRQVYTKEKMADLGVAIVALVDAARANGESKMKGTRGRAWWQEKRNKARQHCPGTKTCPAWLRLKQDRSAYEIIPAAADAVRRIYKLARDGYGTPQITARLNGERVPPIGGRTAYWSRGYVQKLLAMKAVFGEFQPHCFRDGKLVPDGEPIKAYYPPIMSEKEYHATRAAVERRLSQRGPRGRHVRNLFTGLVRDARDGSFMHVKVASTGKHNPYLVSGGVVQGQTKGPYISFPYESFELDFLLMLNDRLAAALLQDGPADRQLEIDALMGKLGELQAAIKATQERLRKKPGDLTLLDTLDALGDEKAATSTALDALRREDTYSHAETLGAARHVITALQSCPPADLTDLRTRLKAHIRALVEEVWVLIEGTRRNRWATVQVFFRNGGWLRYTAPQRWAASRTLFGTGSRAGDPPPADDLRQWRHQAEPKSFPCPESKWVFYVTREELARGTWKGLPKWVHLQVDERVGKA